MGQAPRRSFHTPYSPAVLSSQLHRVRTGHLQKQERKNKPPSISLLFVCPLGSLSFSPHPSFPLRSNPFAKPLLFPFFSSSPSFSLFSTSAQMRRDNKGERCVAAAYQPNKRNISVPYIFCSLDSWRLFLFFFIILSILQLYFFPLTHTHTP